MAKTQEKKYKQQYMKCNKPNSLQKVLSAAEQGQGLVGSAYPWFGKIDFLTFNYMHCV